MRATWACASTTSAAVCAAPGPRSAPLRGAAMRWPLPRAAPHLRRARRAAPADLVRQQLRPPPPRSAPPSRWKRWALAGGGDPVCCRRRPATTACRRCPRALLGALRGGACGWRGGALRVGRHLVAREAAERETEEVRQRLPSPCQHLFPCRGWGGVNAHGTLDHSATRPRRCVHKGAWRARAGAGSCRGLRHFGSHTIIVPTKRGGHHHAACGAVTSL
jgi:hypothetical protein